MIGSRDETVIVANLANSSRLHESGVAIAHVVGAALILTRLAAELRALESVAENGLLLVSSTTSFIAVARMVVSYLRAQVDRLVTA